MKLILTLILSLTSLLGLAKNRPYTDVIKEINAENCPMKKENLFLSKEQRKAIEKKSETKLYGGLALRYIISCEGKEKLYLYVDSHIVRTLNETVIVKVEKEKIKDYLVTSFNEPPEYKAPKKWLAQFKGKAGNKVLKPLKDIDALTGATLTVGASVRTVNKVLAMHQILNE